MRAIRGVFRNVTRVVPGSKVGAAPTAPPRRLAAFGASMLLGGGGALSLMSVVHGPSSIAHADSPTGPPANTNLGDDPKTILPKKSKGETIRVDIGRVRDFKLKEGEVMEVDVGFGKQGKVLLVRSGGRFVCVSDKCPHAGANLASGWVSNNRIYCPAHNASFCLGSGNNIDAPSQDSLIRYPVEEVNGRLYVVIPADGPMQKKRVRAYTKRDDSMDKRTFVIIGTGAAGCAAADQLRQSGFKGRVIMVSSERQLPYDRTALSKNLGPSDEAITLRSAQYWNDHDVELMLGKFVTAVDATTHEIRFKDGETLHYDKALICTGAKPRAPAIPGSTKRNVFVLRDPTDSRWIKHATEGAKHAVVIGSSFIGIETACALKKSGVESVTVVGMEGVPYERVLGQIVGSALQAHAASKLGIKFALGSSVVEFIGKKKTVAGVVLDTGVTLPADVVIVGAGVVPQSQFVHGVSRTTDGGIVVDPFLNAAKDLYAAGDVASFPYWLTGSIIRVEHWNVAAQQGKIAARNMVGRASTYSTIPFFWTVVAGRKVSYVGHAAGGYDDIVIEGDPAGLKFVAYYTKNDRVMGVATMGMPKASGIITEAMRLGRMPLASDLKTQVANLQTIADTLTTAPPPCPVEGCSLSANPSPAADRSVHIKAAKAVDPAAASSAASSAT